MSSRKSSLCRYAMAFVIIVGAALCCLSPAARAGGVSVGFGVDLGPGYGPPPPVAYQPPPIAVAPPPMVVEAAPAPVVVERPPQVAVYSAPVVVEQRSRVYYYYPSYHATSSYSYSHREETRSDYGDGSSRYRQDYYEY